MSNSYLALEQPYTPIGKQARFTLMLDSVPLGQIFQIIGEDSDYNIVPPQTNDKISVSLKNTTLFEALDIIKDTHGYDYTLSGNNIYISNKKTQTKIYKLNYLAGDRGGKTDTRTAASGISGNSSSNQNNSNNSTTTSNNSNQPVEVSRIITNTSKSSVWEEIDATLALILDNHPNTQNTETKKYVLNPQSGLIVVNGTPSELRQTEKYLSKLGVAISKQVMIEAKIIEVQLDKNNQNGINWAGFKKGGNDILSIGNLQKSSIITPSGNGVGISDGLFTAATSGALALSNVASGGIFGLALQTRNFSALLSFLETQGVSQVLSSPRIATLNNQKAVLRVGRDEFYVTNISTSNITNSSNTTTTPSIIVQPFFSGIALDVTPQISDSGEITLHIHPSVSNVSEKQKNVNLGTLGDFTLPLASSSINESDSVVKVKDGNIVAIGGLMKIDEQSTTNSPTLNDSVKKIKDVLSSNDSSYTKKELVILLKPTVIESDLQNNELIEQSSENIRKLYE